MIRNYGAGIEFIVSIFGLALAFLLHIQIIPRILTWLSNLSYFRFNNLVVFKTVQSRRAICNQRSKWLLQICLPKYVDCSQFIYAMPMHIIRKIIGILMNICGHHQFECETVSMLTSPIIKNWQCSSSLLCTKPIIVHNIRHFLFFKSQPDPRNRMINSAT